jgi:hypothetical protein
MLVRAKTKLAVRMVLAVAITAPLFGCDYVNLITGKESCHDWSAHRQANDAMRKSNIDWANGFFPAYYKAAPKNQTLVFPAANAELLHAMDSYCDDHPAVTIVVAATQVMAAATRPASVQTP